MYNTTTVTTVTTTSTTTTYVQPQGVHHHPVSGGHVPVGTGRQLPHVITTTAHVGNQILIAEGGVVTGVIHQPRGRVNQNAPARRPVPVPPPMYHAPSGVVASANVVFERRAGGHSRSDQYSHPQPSVDPRGVAARQIPGADMRRSQ